MRWRTSLASAVVGFSLAAAGCSMGYEYLDPCDPAVLDSIAARGRGEEDSTVRAQAPEPAAPPKLPDVAAPMVQTVGYTAAHVAAVVNGEAILDEELRASAHDMLRRLEGMPEPERSKKQAEVLSQALNSLIEREVVMQDAVYRLTRGPGGEKNLERIKEMAGKEFEKAWVRPIKEQFKIKSDEEFRAFLKVQGVTLEMQQRLWERDFMSRQYLQNRCFPITDKIGHPQMLEYYETHPEQFKVDDEIDWQDLFVAVPRYATRDAAKRSAESVAQRVRNNEDFATLAQQFDDGLSKLSKSQGIGRKHGEIKPAEFETSLFQLKDGEVSVFEQSGGFHVVRMVKHQQAGQMPFDDKAQKLIKDKIRSEIMQRETKRIVTELKRQAVIEVSH